MASPNTLARRAWQDAVKKYLKEGRYIHMHTTRPWMPYRRRG